MAAFAASATGIAAVALIMRWSERLAGESAVSVRLRDLEDVLADCRRKITEIEDHLPEIPPEPQKAAGSTRQASRTRTGQAPKPRS